MAVTVEQIKSEFPEFAQTDPRLIAAKIADAQARLNQSAFGPLWDQAIKYRACHLIAMSPSGEYARLSVKEQSVDGATTTYEREFRKLVRSISGPMVV